MRKFSRFLLVGMTLALLGALVIPISAQDEGGAGQGGILIEGNFGGDIANLNPILINDVPSSNVAAFLYPGLLGLDPATSQFAPNVPGNLATSWEYDDTGTVLTVHLRDDAFWNDGTPITSADYLYAANAIQSGETDSPRIDAFAVADPENPGQYTSDGIVSVEAPDDYTVVITFSNFDCTSLSLVNQIPVVPSATFSSTFATYADMNEDVSYNLSPTVTFGPFSFGEFRPAEQVSLIADQTYPDSVLGYVSPAGWIYKTVADQTVETEQLLAGEINVDRQIPPERMQDMRDNADIQTFDFPNNGYTYMGFNLADPTNPQPGLDDSGNRIDQGHHPLFGDLRVRQAIAKGVDVSGIVDATLFGEGVQMATNAIPTSWAYDNSIKPWDFDPEGAAQLLDDAGWTMNSDTGVRECHGCMYAEEGTPAQFTLLTNSGNPTRERTGQIIQSQLADLGITVDFQAIDFNILVQDLLGQEFDAIIIGWSLGLPDNPDSGRNFYAASNDVPGAGFNFVSYSNPDLEQLYKDGRQSPGCDLATRKDIYVQANTIVRDDLPYLFLFSSNTQYAVRTEVQGFDPYPSFLYWNVDAWSVLAP